MPMDPLEGKKNISSPLRGLENLFESGTAPPPQYKKLATALMYQSIPSLTIPRAISLMGEFPTPGQKKFKIPPPGPIKTS